MHIHEFVLSFGYHIWHLNILSSENEFYLVLQMEEPSFPAISDGEIIGIQFGLASHREIVSGVTVTSL